MSKPHVLAYFTHANGIGKTAAAHEVMTRLETLHTGIECAQMMAVGTDATTLRIPFNTGTISGKTALIFSVFYEYKPKSTETRIDKPPWPVYRYAAQTFVSTRELVDIVEKHGNQFYVHSITPSSSALSNTYTLHDDYSIEKPMRHVQDCILTLKSASEKNKTLLDALRKAASNDYYPKQPSLEVFSPRSMLPVEAMKQIFKYIFAIREELQKHGIKSGQTLIYNSMPLTPIPLLVAAFVPPAKMRIEDFEQDYADTIDHVFPVDGRKRLMRLIDVAETTSNPMHKWAMHLVMRFLLIMTNKASYLMYTDDELYGVRIDQLINAANLLRGDCEDFDRLLFAYVTAFYEAPESKQKDVAELQKFVRRHWVSSWAIMNVRGGEDWSKIIPHAACTLLPRRLFSQLPYNSCAEVTPIEGTMVCQGSFVPFNEYFIGVSSMPQQKVARRSVEIATVIAMLMQRECAEPIAQGARLSRFRTAKPPELGDDCNNFHLGLVAAVCRDKTVAPAYTRFVYDKEGQWPENGVAFEDALRLDKSQFKPVPMTLYQNEIIEHVKFLAQVQMPAPSVTAATAKQLAPADRWFTGRIADIAQTIVTVGNSTSSNLFAKNDENTYNYEHVDFILHLEKGVEAAEMALAQLRRFMNEIYTSNETRAHATHTKCVHLSPLPLVHIVRFTVYFNV